MHSFDYDSLIFSIKLKIINIIKFEITIVAPVLILYAYEKYIPSIKHTILTIPELIITLLKLLNHLIEIIAGNIIILLISITPIILIPITITIADKTAIKLVYLPTFNPETFANSSSKVTINIFL